MRDPVIDRMKNVFCFGRSMDIERFAHLFNFGIHLGAKIDLVRGRPTLVKVLGFGQVMGYQPQINAYMLMMPMCEMSREQREAFEVCRQRYFYLGEWYP